MMEDTLKLTDWLKESNDHFKNTKLFSRKVREYYNGDQLDDTIRTILANRGQPEQYENQIAKHNNTILGFKAERDIEIGVYGRQTKDRGGADMLSALLKAITDVSDYADQVEELDEDLSLEGIAVAELSIKGLGEFDEFGREHKDIELFRVPPDEVYLDPFAKAVNYNTDARYLGRAFWIDKEDLYTLRFPEDKIKELQSSNWASDVIDDDLTMEQVIRDRVLLGYMWYRKFDTQSKKDKFYYAFWSGQTILLQGESPYEFDGFPYEVEFIGRDFKAKDIKYWGLYRDIMPLQDSINYAKLRLHNMLANNKTLVNKGAIEGDDIHKFTDEWNPDNAVVLVEDVNGIKDVRQNAQIQQILSIIIDSRQQITELLNVNKELLGTANNRMSSVAQDRRIETGLVGLSRFIKRSDRLQKKIYRNKMIPMISQYYDTQRVIGIIDEEDVQEYITMNEVVRNPYGAIEMEDAGDGMFVPKVSNKIEMSKWDLVFKVKPKAQAMSDERMGQNVEVLKVVERSMPDLVAEILPDILHNMDGALARKLRKRIQERMGQSQNSPEAQQLQQLQQENARLEMMVKQSQANLNNTKAQAMMDKNKIDLQKAFSRSLIDKQSVQAKNDKNQLDAMRRIY